MSHTVIANAVHHSKGDKEVLCKKLSVISLLETKGNLHVAMGISMEICHGGLHVAMEIEITEETGK
jgi:hypothetical protein